MTKRAGMGPKSPKDKRYTGAKIGEGKPVLRATKGGPRRRSAASRKAFKAYVAKPVKTLTQAEIESLERKRATTGGIKDDPSNTKGETKPKQVGTVRKAFARVPLAAFRLGGGGGGGAGRK